MSIKYATYGDCNESYFNYKYLKQLIFAVFAAVLNKVNVIASSYCLHLFLDEGDNAG